MIGRDGDLKLLRDAIAAAVSGTSQIVLVSGEAGIGKTTLVREAAAEAADGGASVVWGRATGEGAAPPFWPWIQALRGLIDLTPASEQEALSSVTAHLSGELDPQELAASEAARFTLFDRAAQAVYGAAAERPLVVVLEDLHAADLASLRLLQFVVDHALARRLCLLGTYREEEASQLDEIGQPLTALGARGTHVRLVGLTPGEVTTLARTTSRVDIDDHLGERLFLKTRGNPFFVVQMALMVGNRPAHAAGMPIPEEIRALVRSRVGLLPPDTQRALDVAAVAGPILDVSVLAAVLEVHASALNSLLEPAVSAGLLTSGDDLHFTHSLVVEALVEDIDPERRQTLHLALARALVGHAMPDEFVSAIAHHFREAMPLAPTREALSWGRRAAEQAARALAFEAAISAYEGLLDLAPDEHSRCSLLLDLAATVERSEESERTHELYAEALDIAARLEEGELLARATLGMVGRPELFTLYERDTRSIKAALEHAVLPSPSRTMLLARLSTSLVLDEAEKLALNDEALRSVRAMDDIDARAYVLRARQALLIQQHRGNERLSVGSELLELARSAGREDLQAVAHAWRCISLFHIDDLVAGEAELEIAEEMAKRVRDPLLVTLMLQARSSLAAVRGCLDDAVAHVRSAHELLERAGMPWRDFPLVTQLLPIALQRGDLDESERLIDGLMPANPDNLLLLAMRGTVRVHRGDPAFGRLLLDRVTVEGLSAVTPDMRFAAAAYCAVLAHAFRHRIAAQACFDILAPAAGFTAYASGIGGFLGQFDLYLGKLAIVLDDPGAESYLLRALERDRAIGAPTGVVQDEIALAELYLEDGRTQRATELLEHAARLAQELGLEGSQREIERLQAQAAAPSSSIPGEARFTREGEFWTVRFEGEETRLRDSKGLAYLAQLLANPGSELHVVDMAGRLSSGPSSATARPSVDGSGFDVLDREAKAAYRRRVEDLREVIDEAEASGDPERKAAAEEELDALTRELAAAVGLGGRDRRSSSAAERARLSVGRAVRTAIVRISRDCPHLGRHLEATIHTGYFCSYTPDPRAPVPWELR